MPGLRKVLIVDDNQINRELMHEILSDRYELFDAANGAEGLRLLSLHNGAFSAVLLDLIMPVMDGFTFLSTVRDDPILSQIPIIVTTSQDNQTAEVEALSLGAIDFLTKPYNTEIFLHRLDNTIRLHETASLIREIETDSLTGVYSQAAFFSRISTLLNEQPDHAFDIITADIEHFKLINDLCGVKTGDAVLRYWARALSDFAGTDGLCGRLTGDVFAVCIPRPAAYSAAYFDPLRAQLDAYPVSLTLNVRFGVFPIDDPTLPASIMCDRARLACNAIKGRYSDRYCIYDNVMRDELLRQQRIIDSMESAIAQKQYQVYLQPKYELSTGAIIGAEALVRWRHPVHGMIMPGEFIPIFEHNGFITQLDSYVWESVCEKLGEWERRGFPKLPVSVNVSRADLYDPSLPARLTDMVRRHGLSPSLLHLEITESAYTDNPEQIISAATALKDLGFIIEMDDFGTGYSSLNMLSRLPFDILKLDISFVQSENWQEDRAIILSFVISLAKSLGRCVVAEGVETAEQAERLRKLDCDYVQGYFYARPMPVPDYELLLAAECQHRRAGEGLHRPPDRPAQPARL